MSIKENQSNYEYSMEDDVLAWHGAMGLLPGDFGVQEFEESLSNSKLLVNIS